MLEKLARIETKLEQIEKQQSIYFDVSGMFNFAYYLFRKVIVQKKKKRKRT